MRALILALPLLALLFGAGWAAGRAGKRRAVAKAVAGFAPVVTAARAVVNRGRMDPLGTSVEVAALDNAVADYHLALAEARR